MVCFPCPPVGIRKRPVYNKTMYVCSREKEVEKQNTVKKLQPASVVINNMNISQYFPINNIQEVSLHTTRSNYNV
jgi:hypothetical protein